MNSVKGKTILIAGATDGLGKRVAQHAAEAGVSCTDETQRKEKQ